MNQHYITRIVRDTDNLPELSRDAMLRLRALLRRRARHRTLSAFETAMYDLVDADLTGADEVALVDLTVRASSAARAEFEGSRGRDEP